MSKKKRKNDYVASYEFSDAWDEVLLGDRDNYRGTQSEITAGQTGILMPTPQIPPVSRQDLRPERLDS